ncbi:MAG: TadE family protein [Burkholderiaceae bacterium]
MQTNYPTTSAQNISHLSAGCQSARQSKRQVIRRLNKRSKQAGAAVVEFSMVAILLFMILFTIVDFGNLFFTNLTMQHAVREGTRYAVTGNTGLATNQGSATVRCDAAVEKIREQSMGYYDNLNSSVQFKTVDSNGNVANIGGGGCYNAGDIIVIQVTATAPLMTPWLQAAFGGNGYQFSVSTTMKNEEFQ